MIAERAQGSPELVVPWWGPKFTWMPSQSSQGSFHHNQKPGYSPPRVTIGFNYKVKVRNEQTLPKHSTIGQTNKSQKKKKELLMYSGKEPTCHEKPACQCRRLKRHRFSLWVGKIPWRRKWHPSPVFLPGETHGQRNLVGYGPRGCKESDTTEAT